MKSPSSNKLPGIYERHNTRPMPVRQPPTMLGERVFTSVVNTSDGNLDVPTIHQFHTPPYYPTIEATSIEMESHQIDVVDLTTPSKKSNPKSQKFHQTTSLLLLVNNSCKPIQKCSEFFCRFLKKTFDFYHTSGNQICIFINHHRKLSILWN